MRSQIPPGMLLEMRSETQSGMLLEMRSETQSGMLLETRSEMMSAKMMAGAVSRASSRASRGLPCRQRTWLRSNLLRNLQDHDVGTPTLGDKCFAQVSLHTSQNNEHLGCSLPPARLVCTPPPSNPVSRIWGLRPQTHTPHLHLYRHHISASRPPSRSPVRSRPPASASCCSRPPAARRTS